MIPDDDAFCQVGVNQHQGFVVLVSVSGGKYVHIFPRSHSPTLQNPVKLLSAFESATKNSSKDKSRKDWRVYVEIYASAVYSRKPIRYTNLEKLFCFAFWLCLEEMSVKVICKQQDLSRGLSVVGHAVSSRSTLPILANILLATDQGRVRLSATNLEIGINCWIDAEIHEEGTTTVPAKTFTELVNSLTQGQVDLTVSDETNTINVKTAKSNANVKGMD